FYFIFFNTPPTTEIYTLSLHDALPISDRRVSRAVPGSAGRDSALLLSAASYLGNNSFARFRPAWQRSLPGSAEAMTMRLARRTRSEEHTSELQSRGHLVCRLLLEKKKK